MTDEYAERIAVALERIAAALEREHPKDAYVRRDGLSGRQLSVGRSGPYDALNRSGRRTG